MPFRLTPFASDQYYHVYNRGVAKQLIFLSFNHYQRFQQILRYYLDEKPDLKLSRFLSLSVEQQLVYQFKSESKSKQVEIVAYCLMPNHYHLLLKQLTKNGISNYLRLVGNSYTRYFNTTENRVGPIFQGRFKAILIESDQYLIQLSRYIHLNPLVAGLTPRSDLHTFPYSSFQTYIGATRNAALPINTQPVLSQFSSSRDYEDFCLNTTDYSIQVNQIKNYTIDQSE